MPKKDAVQWFDKGKALVELGNVNEGIRYLLRAVAEAPYYAESVAYLAEVLERVDKADEAARLRGALDSISDFCLVRRVPKSAVGGPGNGPETAESVAVRH